MTNPKRSNRNKRSHEQQVLIQQELVHHHSGPLPSPNDFAAYDQVMPGTAERILVLTETEAEHRRSQEVKAMTRMHREIVIGQMFALLIGLAGIGTSAYLAAIGQSMVAIAIGGGTLVALVTAFIKGRGK